jgi:acyl carrier protein
MDRQEIIAKVDLVLIDEFELEPAVVKPEAHLFNDLELDSLDAVDLVAALEASFGHRVAEDDAKEVRTVGDVYALIEKTAQNA